MIFYSFDERTNSAMFIYDSRKGNLFLVKQLRDAGLNIIPIKTDGSKSPAIPRWKPYQTTIYPWDKCAGDFASKGHPPAIGIICGITSGNLEVIDFDLEHDTIFPSWCKQVEREQPGLLATLPIVQTPKWGSHVYVRCSEIEGNQKLAERPSADDPTKPETLVETRGQGGLVLAPGSPPWSHSTGRPYLLVQGDLQNIPRITPEQRAALLDVARGFNRYVKPEQEQEQRPSPTMQKLHRELADTATGNRPGDDYNRRASWEEVLTPHGWTYSHSSGDVEYWTRPGGIGHSANVNYGNTGLLYVFSANALPLQRLTAYTKFAAYALLNHGGDYHKAAQALAVEGYGQGKRYDVNDFLFGGFYND
jgi:hypothetical protein